MSTPTYEKIQHIELTSAGTITFSSIPATFTDLMVVISGRSSRNNIEDGIGFQINSLTSGYTYRFLRGSGSSADSQATPFEQTWAGVLPAAQNTSNTFGNATIYVPNYASSTAKSYSSDSVMETNATTSYQAITAITQSSTAAITSITLSAQNGNLVAGSSATLYGIKSIPSAPKATGGIISYVNGYWVHTFTSSGTFTPTQNLSNVEYLVVAGGGGARSNVSGGGGAGGYRSSVVGESSGGGASAESRLSLTSGTNYTVTVGAGGAVATNGSDSVFGSITATGGGTGGSYQSTNAATGGSGGGAGGRLGQTTTGASGTTNQGFGGGTSQSNSDPNFYNAAGGGGAGGAGGNSLGLGGAIGGNGGAGLTSSITGTAIARAGGGAGGGGGTDGSGGGGTATAGGGNGGKRLTTNGQNGTPNTGGGGGGEGGGNNPGTGGSGIVIVRYQ